MHFCNICDNLYYIKISGDDKDKLLYYCRNCGNTEGSNEDTLVVSKTTYKKTNNKYSTVINEFTKLDPTLPRIDTIPCPNESCSSHKKDDKSPNEIIYIRYDDINLKYVYLCVNCDTVWKT